MTVNWNELHHAYGPASDIPPLLAELKPDPRDPVWGELWSRICHQGTVYPASLAALPELVTIASRWEPSQRPMILGLASDIVTGANSQPEFRSARSALAEWTKKLSDLTSETLAADGLSAGDFVHVLQASLSFRGIHPWDSQLERLVDEEFEAVCPSCGADLLIAVGSYGFFVSNEDYIGGRKPKTSAIDPADSAQLTGAMAWVYAELRRADHHDLVKRALHVFGSSACTVCGKRFDIPVGISLAYPPPN